MSNKIEIYRVLAVVCLAAVVACLVYVAAGGATTRAARLGLRGVKRKRTLAKNELFARFDPLIRWAARRVSGFLSESRRSLLDRQLMLAGDFMGLHPEELVGLWALSGIGGLALGAVVNAVAQAPMALVLCPVVGLFLPYLAVTGEIEKRSKTVSRELPYAIDMFALAMGAGLDFAGAVRQYAEKSRDKDSALVEELQLMLWLMQTGQTRRQAIASLCERVPIDAVQEFSHSVIQAEERGNPLAETLRVQAQSSRMRRTVRAEEAAAKAGVKMVGPLFMAFGCIMILLLAPVMFELQANL